MLPNFSENKLLFLLHPKCRTSFQQCINISILGSKVVCEGGAIDAGKCQTSCVLIPDIYFCLFSLFSGLHGSNFCCDETEQQSLWSSLQGKSQCPPLLLPGQEGFGRPKGMGSFGGWSGEKLQNGVRCSRRGVLMGRKEEGDYKHSANDLKHTNNTVEINGRTQMKQIAKCFLSLDPKKKDRKGLKHTQAHIHLVSLWLHQTTHRHI